MWELQFEIETSCSLNCVHCSSLKMRQQGIRAYSDDNIIDFVKLFNSSLQIYLTGGEPLNYTELASLCNKIHNENNQTKIGIYSTGNFSNNSYINGKVAKKLKECSVDNIYFSIYSDLFDEHDAWTGIRGSFANTIASIKTVKKYGIIPKSHIVLTKNNYRKLDNIINYCKEIGIEEVRILRLTPYGSAKNNWEEIGIPIDEQNRVIESLIKNKDKYNIKLTFSGYPSLHPCRPFKHSKGCEAGIKLLYIDNLGDIYPCACSKGLKKICNITDIARIKEYINSVVKDSRPVCFNKL